MHPLHSILLPLLPLLQLASPHPARNLQDEAPRLWTFHEHTPFQLALNPLPSRPTSHDLDPRQSQFPVPEDPSIVNDHSYRPPPRTVDFRLRISSDAPPPLRGRELRVDPHTHFIRLDSGVPVRFYFANARGEEGKGRARVKVRGIKGRELIGVPRRDLRFYNAGYELKLSTADREKGRRKGEIVAEWREGTFEKRVFCVTGENEHLWFGGNCERTSQYGGTPRFSLEVEYLYW